MSDVLQQLAAVIAERRAADPADSYVASLHHRGLNKILEKVGEEAIEVILAARDVQEGAERQQLLGEVADLWFHCMVMLAHLDCDVTEVLDTLQQRAGVSGHEEKASRKQP